MHNRQSGNVLFLILMGIILFSALAMAMRQGMRGGPERLSQSRVDTLADDVLMTAASYEKAVQRLLSKGNSENRISFTRVSGDGYELSPASSASEQVFNINGGGAQYLDPAKDALDSNQSALANYGVWVFTSTMNLEGMGKDASDAPSKDLLAILPFVRKDICIAINKRMGITNPSGNPPVEGSNMGYSKYTGSFLTGSLYLNNGPIQNNGIKAGCVEGTTVNGIGDVSGKYFFYYALIAR